jgi:hypothetical protein
MNGQSTAQIKAVETSVTGVGQFRIIALDGS